MILSHIFSNPTGAQRSIGQEIYIPYVKSEDLFCAREMWEHNELEETVQWALENLN